ncbi:MAG: bifunctional 3,4-dihydroxy-2-butanone-4-phosphate synthase/GTP cyclohydrolase II [Flammeovirgaceae bacterium]|jgi:3,4-dihydroxy 2-butanone 4-phosphate synthase / GTP cyclohydrolase II|nr:bifunctional 3,4-dihydroxy-2-butanone-4-phosphate synthase/GTP cyclohydrolase II [Flammeovirgaceae bacterium]|tara:strand:- start:10486 stop:11700 length:1215 start_codon:yes stop_codon:yes gene_type:complete
MEDKIRLDKIEDAIEAIRNGEVIVVVDDEDRENEGDFICAAEKITPDIVNFMAREGRGLICVPLIEARCEELGLDLMVGKNTALHETPFTVSVDLKSVDTTTGISTSDRSMTIKALAHSETKPENLGRPGHIFPLKAKQGGVLRRAGHTEAAIDFARLAGLYPAGVLIEVLKEDGTMARLPDLRIIADRFNLRLVTINDLIAYRLNHESLIEEQIRIDLPTLYGDFKLKAYRQTNTGDDHLVLYKGDWKLDEPILVRVHSSCVTGDIFGSSRCDCGDQLQSALRMIEMEGKGMVVYMNQEGRGIGLINKLKAYKLQEDGMDTVEANEHLGFKGDERDYGVGAQIIRDMGISKLKLITNNPKKRVGLIGYGLEIIENISIEVSPNIHNQRYLETKRDRLGHEILK